MAQWVQTLDLKDVWQSGDFRLIARTAAERLRLLTQTPTDGYLDEERLEFAEEFEDLADDPDADVRYFDDVLSRVYDWADTPLDAKWGGKKLCWVTTDF